MTRKKLIKIAAIPGILLVGFITMQALGSTKKQSKRKEQTPEARAVETRALEFGELTLSVAGNGVIESERVLVIVSEATGRVLYAKNNLKDGTFAKQGEVVMRVDARDVTNDLLALRSEFMNAVASLLPELRLDEGPVYRRWFDYFNSLDISQPVPELPEITKPQEKIQVSAKDIYGKYFAVKNQELKLSKYEIHAPFSGFIASSQVIENTFVAQGQTLFTLSDARNLVIPVPLLVEESQRLDYLSAPHVAIHSDEDEGNHASGRVTRKDSGVQRNSQTMNVYVTFTNSDLNPHFLPGNYVRVEIEGRTLQDVAAIPRNLLDPESRVYTFEDSGTLGQQPLEVEALQGDMAIVRNSVPEGTVIVTTILQKPLVGMDIRSVNMPELMPQLTDSSELNDRPADAAELASEARS